ncbi:MAG: glycosyltransferase [Vicinamibacterales bacterium]|nr:glycosyltransferase [Vicinamibacterales bacterium]
MSQRVILFGAGSLGRRALAAIDADTQVVCFLDSASGKAGTAVDGVPVRSPGDLPSLEYDLVVITSQYSADILALLRTMGVPTRKTAVFGSDFPRPAFPARCDRSPAPVVPRDRIVREVLRVVVGDGLADVASSDTQPAELAAMTNVLRAVRPQCAIEIGTFNGESLRLIHHFAGRVYSLDADATCHARLGDDLPRAEFIAGFSQQTLPLLLDSIGRNPEHPPVEFVFVDGDHSRAGVASDLRALLTFRPTTRMVVLMHDVANPTCRQGMLDVEWASCPYVHHVDLDFVPGILHHIESAYRQMWGGLGLALFLPEERTEPLVIRQNLSQQYDAMYRGSFHANDEPNPFAQTFQPFFVAPGGRPRFSACLPNYNDAAVMVGAVRAMLGQTRPPDELLICDDGSTDDNWDRLQELGRLDASIRLVRNERNLGVVGALNRLLQEARGDLIYFGGADDRVEPLFFENVLNLLATYESAQLGMAAFYSVDEDGQILSLNRVSRWPQAGFYSPASCLHDYFAAEGPHHSLSSGTIYRKQALRSVGGFRPELGHWTDTFAIRALCLSAGCVYTPHPGARFTCKSTSFSGRQHRDLETSLGIINRVAELMRSTEFRHLFPETHVADWQERFCQLAHVFAAAEPGA